MIEKNTNNDRKPNYPLRRTLAATALVAGAFGIAKGGEVVQNELEHKEIGTQTVVLDQGEAVQGAVKRAVDKIAEEKGFDPNKVDGVVHAAQSAYGDFTPGVSESVAQVGDEVDVTVSKNGFGDYNVEANVDSRVLESKD